MQVYQLRRDWGRHTKLGGERRCTEPNAIIDCISSKRGRRVRGEEIINLYIIILSVNAMRSSVWKGDSPRIQYCSILNTTNDWGFGLSWRYDKRRRDPWLTRFRTPKCSKSSWYYPGPRHMQAQGYNKMSCRSLYQTRSPTSHAK